MGWVIAPTLILDKSGTLARLTKRGELPDRDQWLSQVLFF